jgi:uncharacterized protein YbjQ (UPF0145 family)
MFEVVSTVLLLVAGYFFGSRNEKKHIEELLVREKNLLTKLPTRADQGPKIEHGEAFLVTSSVVIASDYFKNFIGALKNFFGGRMTTHETLLDRARREAVCRLREKALARGAQELVDVHICTNFIDQMGVEISTYGTALKN